MSTDFKGLPITVEQVLRGYTPTYKALFAQLYDSAKTVPYEPVMGEIIFKETDILGNATTQRINAQDTEFKHVQAGEISKKFNKYVNGVKFNKSGWQSAVDIQKLINQIIDINLMKMDKDVFHGVEESAGVYANNALLNSTDPKHVTLPEETLSQNPDVNEIKAYFDSVIRQTEEYVGNAPKKIVLMGDVVSKVGTFVPNTAVSVLNAIASTYTSDRNLTFLSAPENLKAPSGVMVFTPAANTFRYVSLPRLYKQGFNDEHNYSWFTVIDGSAMCDVERKGGIIVKKAKFGSN